jgi:outer membrane immunogenic protein
MMMKRTLLATAALLTMSVAAHADNYNDHYPNNGMNNHYPTAKDEGKISPLSGVYIGGYGGYGWTNASITNNSDANSINGADYGVFAGYSLDTLLDHTIGMGINGSLEGFYGWSNADDNSGGVDYQKKNDWGVSFRPGLSFVQDYTMGLKPYGILGYRRAEFENSSAGASNTDWHNGFELGVGTEVIAYGNVGVRLDYSHVWYGTKNGINPEENNLRLGVGYHF